MISTIELYNLIVSYYINLYNSFKIEQNLAHRESLFNSISLYYELLKMIYYSIDV